MNAKALTVTDFLLARIAEDEANLPSGFDCWYAPERYAAECAAKRAVVELHNEKSDIVGRYELQCPTCGTDYPCDTLRALGAVYADHPNYDQRWRP